MPVVRAKCLISLHERAFLALNSRLLEEGEVHVSSPDGGPHSHDPAGDPRMTEISFSDNYGVKMLLHFVGAHIGKALVRATASCGLRVGAISAQYSIGDVNA